MKDQLDSLKNLTIQKAKMIHGSMFTLYIGNPVIEKHNEKENLSYEYSLTIEIANWVIKEKREINNNSELVTQKAAMHDLVGQAIKSVEFTDNLKISTNRNFEIVASKADEAENDDDVWTLYTPDKIYTHKQNGNTEEIEYPEGVSFRTLI